MFFYRFWVASHYYHGDDLLTYSSAEKLGIGSVALVTLNNKTVPAIVSEKVSKPPFKTKTIVEEISKTVPTSLLKLIEWMDEYYPSPKGSLAQLLLPSNLQSYKSSQKLGRRQEKTKLKKLPVATPEQKEALAKIRKTQSLSVLLHGETGTGKTRVYAELTQKILANKKSVVILTPEIGLTTPLAKYIEEYISDPVITIHSSLTPAERRNIWLELINEDSPVVVIGPRSALFSPLKDLGLIIIDEAHDGAYKQDQAPRYQTTRVAAKLAELNQAKLIMGTATPSVSDYYTLEKKGTPIVRLEKLAIQTAKPPNITVVKISDRSRFSKSYYLSSPLLDSINESLGEDQQSLVFLNRRGTARVVLCSNCGWQKLCTNCDTPVVYHGDKHEVRCHICNYKSNAPSDCPQCKNAEVTFKGIGTKALVDELKHIFPHASIKRFDTDQSKSDQLFKQYEDIVSGSTDIIVGTQMLSKGLDLPKLSTVGVVQADTGLFIPDYSSSELAYQQLYQIIGRVGRGHVPGRVVVQTFRPDSPAIQAAIKRNYGRFYSKELEEREQFMFPPFCFLLKISCSRSSSSSAKTASTALKVQIASIKLPVRILGPSPAFREKSNKKYTWQLVIKAKQRSLLLQIIQQLPANCTYDIDPVNLL